MTKLLVMIALSAVRSMPPLPAMPTVAALGPRRVVRRSEARRALSTTMARGFVPLMSRRSPASAPPTSPSAGMSPTPHWLSTRRAIVSSAPRAPMHAVPAADRVSSVSEIVSLPDAWMVRAMLSARERSISQLDRSERTARRPPMTLFWSRRSVRESTRWIASIRLVGPAGSWKPLPLTWTDDEPRISSPDRPSVVEFPVNGSSPGRARSKLLPRTDVSPLAASMSMSCRSPRRTFAVTEPFAIPLATIATPSAVRTVFAEIIGALPPVTAIPAPSSSAPPPARLTVVTRFRVRRTPAEPLTRIPLPTVPSTLVESMTTTAGAETTTMPPPRGVAALPGFT